MCNYFEYLMYSTARVIDDCSSIIIPAASSYDWLAISVSLWLNGSWKHTFWSGHTRLETSSSIPNLEIKQSRAVSVLG